MKKIIGFFNIDENDNGDIFWNGFPVEKMDGNKLKINGKIFDIPQSIQKLLTNTSKIPIKQLNDQDGDIFNNILKVSILRIIKQNVVNQNQVDINNLKAILRNMI